MWPFLTYAFPRTWGPSLASLPRSVSLSTPFCLTLPTAPLFPFLIPTSVHIASGWLPLTGVSICLSLSDLNPSQLGILFCRFWNELWASWPPGTPWLAGTIL